MFVASPSIFRDLSSRSLSPLPVQQPRGILVERSRLISQRNILSALTAGILALPSLSAPLIICKTNPAVRTPVPASRARRRYPVVNTSAMLAVAADWHTWSSVPKSLAGREIPILQSIFRNSSLVLAFQPLTSYGRNITADCSRPAHREAARALPPLRQHQSFAQRDAPQEDRDRPALALRIMQA